jgi:hypothetical protein
MSGIVGYPTIHVRTPSEESRYQRWRDGTDRPGVQGLMNEQDATRAFLEEAGVIAPMQRPITDFSPAELRRLADRLETAEAAAAASRPATRKSPPPQRPPEPKTPIIAAEFFQKKWIFFNRKQNRYVGN